MKLFLLVSLSLALLCTLVCGQPKVNDDDQQSYRLIMPSIDIFTRKLYSQLATSHPNENLIFSSLSISIALSMVSLGASSDTRPQIQQGLDFSISSVPEEKFYKGFQQLMKNLRQSNSDLELNIANALFVDKQFKLLQTYIDKAETFYRSEVFSTDFQKLDEAIKQVNSYVEEKTDGKIKQLLSGLNPATVLVLINTILFKGSWKDGFNVKHTKEEDFHVDEKTVVKVPMMRREGRYNVTFLPENGCTVVKIPYKGNYSAIYIIPKKGKLQEAEKYFQEGQMGSWITNMKEKKIKVFIPKMSVSKKFDLKEVLTPIGFAHLFSNGANLTGISDDPRLKVSEAAHKAAIEVEEKGTVAAAATSVGFVATSLIIYPEVKANHPFIMTIVKDEDNLPLFTMRIINPTL